jgi:hypothetical protein
MKSRDAGLKARNLIKRVCIALAIVNVAFVALVVVLAAIGVPGTQLYAVYGVVGLLLPLAIAFAAWMLVLCIYFVKFTLVQLVGAIVVINLSLVLIFVVPYRPVKMFGALALAAFIAVVVVYIMRFDPDDGSSREVSAHDNDSAD